MKETEEKYRAINEGSSNGIYLFQNGRFKFFNESFVEMTGYNRKELKNLNFLELVHPDYRDEIEEWTKKALAGDTSNLPNKHEFKALRKDGSSIWVQLNPTLIEYRGKPAIVGNVTDITEKKETEEKPKESEKRYRSLFEDLGDVVFVQSRTEDNFGEILEANPAAIKQTGYSRGELIGMNVFDFFVEGEKIDTSAELEEELEDQEEVILTQKKQRKDGSEFWVEVRLTPISFEGKEAALSINRDITERKETKRKLRESEERYRRLTEEIGDLVSIIDFDGVYQFINEKPHKEILGYESEELIGKNGFSLLHPEDRDRIKSNFREDIVEGGQADSRFRIEARDGSYRWVECHARFMPEDEEAFLVSRDITERKKTEERERFLHVLLRHDLGNKLQVVRGYLEMLEDADFNDKESKFLKKALRSAEGCAELIEKVRTLRNVETGAEVKVVNPRPVIKDIVDEHEKQANKKDMEIEVDVPESQVIAGPLLQELFRNLVINSLEHSRGDKVEICGREEDSEVIITVRDDGRGIGDKLKNEIFDRGFKKGYSTGSGLGLTLVKNLPKNTTAMLRSRIPNSAGLGLMSIYRKIDSDILFSLLKKLHYFGSGRIRSRFIVLYHI